MFTRFWVMLQRMLVLVVALSCLVVNAPAYAGSGTVYIPDMGFENGLNGWQTLGGGASFTTSYALTGGGSVLPQYGTNEGVLSGGSASVDAIAAFFGIRATGTSGLESSVGG